MKTQTLAGFFGLPDEDEVHEALSDAVEARDRSGGILAAAGQALGPFADRLTDVIANELARTLDDPVSDLLVEAWRRYRPLRKYRDENEYPPSEVVEAVLSNHSVQVSDEPRIEVLVDGSKVAELTFQLDLELSVDAACLTIQGGRILEIAPGSCTGTGTLKFEGTLIAQRETRELTLPGSVSLGDGIPIV